MIMDAAKGKEDLFSMVSALAGSNLKPLYSFGKSTSNAIFSLKIKDGVPFLSTLSEASDLDRFPISDKRLFEAYLRICTDIPSQNALWHSSIIAKEINLHQYPHLARMITRGTILTGEHPGDFIEFSDATAYIRLILKEEGSNVKPRIQIIADGKELNDVVFLADDMLLSGDKIYETPGVGDNYARIESMLQPLPRDLLDIYLSLFLSYFVNITPEYKGREARFQDVAEKGVATLVLEKVAPDRALYLRMSQTLPGIGDDMPTDVNFTRIASVLENDEIYVRNVENIWLKDDIEYLKGLLSKSAPSAKARKEIYNQGAFFIVPSETASPFLMGYLPEVLERFRIIGSEKLKEYKVTPATPKLNVNLSSGIDFLEGDADVELAGETFTLTDILNQFKTNRYIKLSDGNRAIVDEKYMMRLQRLFHSRDKNGRVKVSFFDLPELDSMLEQKLKGTLALKSRKIFEGFNHLSEQQPKKLPVNATLRPYQQEGVKWIQYLYDNKLGGCLADDMGLGKTLQTIAVLSGVYPCAKLPSLVVMPRSLLFNWENELGKFAPQLRVHTYYGANRNLTEAMNAQVVLTTYAVVRNDIEMLREKEFQYIVLDESQNIKNVNAQTTLAVTLLNAEHRLALSGTPVENNLTELYSLFRFLNPTMFGSIQDFNTAYTYPIQKGGDSDAMESLRRKIFPFMLRRLKRDVLKDLPDRIEQTIYVEMSEEQHRMYEQRRLSFRKIIKDAISEKGVAGAQFVMFQALSELRRIASVPESMSDSRVKSPKIDQLIESLSMAVENNHKVVVFFNFIAGLDLVGKRLEEIGIEFESMTGSTSAANRKNIVEKFQIRSECKVLLMTLKVGGVGLNLTAADTVYIFEPWWNKAAEEQAINRLHRIGQKATVNSYSIITVDTIEEKILMLQQKKKDLVETLISADSDAGKSLTEEDIDFILS